MDTDYLDTLEIIVKHSPSSRYDFYQACVLLARVFAMLDTHNITLDSLLATVRQQTLQSYANLMGGRG